MCGRFVSSSGPDEIAKYFGVDAVGEKVLEPNYNTAPSSQIYAVANRDGERALDTYHWGLLPIWAKNPSVGNRMINARSETLAEKNAYKHAFRKRRCLIPVDGFYEWSKVDGEKKKQPYYITRADGDMFAFAGLWERWRGPDRSGDDVVESCSIITGSPNDKMAEIHDRMPVMLAPDSWERWLDPEFDDLDELAKLFVPAPSELIRIHPVTTEVNNARNKGEHLTDPVTL